MALTKVHKLVLVATLAICACAAVAVVSAETIEPPDAFVAQAFGGAPPAPAALWLTPDIQEGVKRIMGHRLGALRQRYWRAGGTSVWILEEIGKEEPITAGFVIEDGQLQHVALLVYRESRGWEIRYPYFRAQFVGAALDKNLGLDANIDGISGATLSVRAMQKMARLALYFHDLVSLEEN